AAPPRRTPAHVARAAAAPSAGRHVARDRRCRRARARCPRARWRARPPQPPRAPGRAPAVGAPRAWTKTRAAARLRRPVASRSDRVHNPRPAARRAGQAPSRAGPWRGRRGPARALRSRVSIGAGLELLALRARESERRGALALVVLRRERPDRVVRPAHQRVALGWGRHVVAQGSITEPIG